MADNSFTLTERSKPSIAFLENFIKSIKRGTMMGKLKMAIKVELLLTLEAMAETIVRMVEKLKPPNTTAIP